MTSQTHPQEVPELVEIAARAMVRGSRPGADPDKSQPAPRGISGIVPLWCLYEHMAEAVVTDLLAALTKAAPPVEGDLDLRHAVTTRRRSLGWSLRDLESETGIGFSTLARFERGERIGNRTRAHLQEWAALQQSRSTPGAGDQGGWVRIPKPTLDDLAEIGEVAEGAMLSEKDWAEIGHAVWDLITRDAEVTDWSSAIRGKFYDPKATPVPVDKCAACGFERKEHAYNGACYGICGEFVSPVPVDASGALQDDIRHSIIRQLGDDPHADRIILQPTDWDIVLNALATPTPVAGNALDAGTVEACARALVDKLDLIGPDPGGAFTMLEIHGMPYRGPHYGDELKALKAALSPGKTGSAGVGE